MGLCVVPIRPEKIETIPAVMQSIGLPLVRTEDRENGIYYFFHHPKQPNKDRAFWITHEKIARPRFLMGGMSATYTRIFQSFRAAGVFENDEGDAWLKAITDSDS
jgi:hypothetical protein